MRLPLRITALLALAPIGALSGGIAHAAPEEIQVYDDELNAKGTPGLELHVNDVVKGDGSADYTGAETNAHRWRATPEFSLGLGSGFEAGAYLPLATLAPDGVLRVQGAKLRMKWIAPHGEAGFYYGLNYEIGYSNHHIDENPWNNEVKLIGGWRGGRWRLAVNGNIDFSLSGPALSPATLEIATKAGYAVSPKTSLGIESYNGVGALRSLARFDGSEHSTYAVIDTEIGRWGLNAGIGKGYGANKDSLIVKFLISVPIGKR